MTTAPPTLEFTYDISCPFAYIASTRVRALAARTNATLIYRPVLLGAIYRATSAPQGAGGSASDVFNPAKKAVTGVSMQRTLKRYGIKFNPPPQHPRKTVNALRLLYCVADDGGGEESERAVLTDALFRAYWVQGRDVSDASVLLEIVKQSGIKSAPQLSAASFTDANARKELETATAEAISRGAFGVPGFWIPGVEWRDVEGRSRAGRFFWGQDRMHFVEATLLSLSSTTTSSSISSSTTNSWTAVPRLQSLMPRCTSSKTIPPSSGKVKLEFWFDFSSPWAFLGYTQLSRLQRQFGPSLQIELKPYLLGALFREIGAPMVPGLAVSEAKARWSRQDHADWVGWWNAVGCRREEEEEEEEGGWRGKVSVDSACWSHDANVSDDPVLSSVLDKAGYNGAELIARANAPAVKDNLRHLTAEAKELGICGVPTYRVLRDSGNGEWKLIGGLVWGQDEINVVEDLIAGWDPERSDEVAEVGKGRFGGGGKEARL
ncbi:hypothetical protein N0V83_001063 [Neocucurbitaria cava]|uniref:DSBA-like thioredoxin domain-containing protein n=1 Tax=Neocucurbitaria cava TaxID=798079 RepID=A0A9W9CQ43_9PLEO|nr:hypothetical protein N0V83_001063 [Neocucurbitaria cava]